ncbi:MAG TPA: PQQ-dependent sugar dehydrogenase [Actinomycetes bacterium]|nr:PQQ-dependent sugar dehydrogenase [Actinomycetes bacterium]
MASIQSIRRVLFTLAVLGLAIGASAPPMVTAAIVGNTEGSTITPATSLPAGFSDVTLFSLNHPTAIAFTPDGRMLVTTDAGLVRVYQDDTLLAKPALNLSSKICSGGERGMMGVAVDPAFSDNHYIYVFWTFNKFDNECPIGTADTPVNRVSRYTLGADSRVVAGSGKVIVDNLPSPATGHNAGDLHFGSNELLYITVGDGGCQVGSPGLCQGSNANSRRLDIPNGKVLRVTRAGKVPATNPFVGVPGARRCTARTGVEPGTGPCTETFAYGFRNPFRFMIKPGTNQVWVNDVGQDLWEEIDTVAAGRDYGWNVREGYCEAGSTTSCDPDPNFADPIFSYDHTTDCRSITGAAFGPTSWGKPYAGKYLFADFTCNSVFRLAPLSGGGFVAKPFFPADGPVELTVGPGPNGDSLYYLGYFGNEVHRVSQTN